MVLRTSGQFFGETRRRRSVAGITLFENYYRPNQSTAKHSHELTLFYFVLNGVCRERAGRQLQDHGTATLVYLPAGESHATQWSPAEGGSCFHLELDAGSGAAQRFQEGRIDSCGANSYLAGPPVSLIKRLYDEFADWDSCSGLIAEGLTIQLLGEIAREFSGRSFDRGNWLVTVEECLRERAAAPPTTSELAGMVNVHPSHLIRAFRQRYHTTPGEYVRRVRVEEAQRRLSNDPGLSIGDLALELGFADQSHFTRVFRAQTGASPGTYRRSHSVPRK